MLQSVIAGPGGCLGLEAMGQLTRINARWCVLAGRGYPGRPEAVSLMGGARWSPCGTPDRVLGTVSGEVTV
jgi:hypothetical protein